MGLNWWSLFSEQPPDGIRTLAAQRAKREAQSQAARQEYREAADRCRKLTTIVDVLGNRLACLPNDSPMGDAETRLFHDAVALLHAAETVMGVLSGLP